MNMRINTGSEQTKALVSGPSGFPTCLNKDLRLVHYEPDTRLSLVQRKLQTVLLANAVHTGIHHPYHIIRTKLACEQVGWEQSRDRKSLFESVSKLAKVQFLFSRLSLDEEQVNLAKKRRLTNGIGLSQFLADAWFLHDEQGHSIIRYMLGPTVKEYVAHTLQSDMFDLETIRRLSTEPALALYENFYHYRHMGETDWIPIPTLQALLGTANLKHYEDTRRLTQKVLQPAVKVVTRESNVAMSYETQRTNRRISHIKFFVEEKRCIDVTPRQPLLPEITAGVCFNPEVVKKLTTMGVDRKVAEQLAIENAEETILNAIRYTLKAKEAKDRKGDGDGFNVGGYVVSAIKGKWGSETATEKLKREQRERETAERELATQRTQKMQVEKERREVQLSRSKAAAFIDKLDHDQLEEIKQAFLADRSMRTLFKPLIEAHPHTWMNLEERGLQSAFDRFVLKNCIGKVGQASLL